MALSPIQILVNQGTLYDEIGPWMLYQEYPIHSNYYVCISFSTHIYPLLVVSGPWFRPHNSQRHRRPMAFGAPTNGLGALESSLLFCYSLTCDDFGALSCPFKMVLKMGALQTLISRPVLVPSKIRWTRDHFCKKVNPLVWKWPFDPCDPKWPRMNFKPITFVEVI